MRVYQVGLHRFYIAQYITLNATLYRKIKINYNKTFRTITECLDKYL